MKKILLIFSGVTFWVVLIFGGLYYSGIINFRSFPKELKNPKKIILNCDYQDKKLTIEETLYENVDQYYSKEPKKLQYSVAEKYDKFVYSYEEDKTIALLGNKIKQKSLEIGIEGDRVLDLATCFIQNIPYDDDKAKLVLSQDAGTLVSGTLRDKIIDRFPYETLYDNEGICTDKSYLEAAIMRELGYGVSILTFDKERHMAPGIKVPAGYSSFNTGFAFVETTNTGYLVGQIPTMKENEGKALNVQIEKAKSDELIPQIPKPNFSNPTKVINVADGREYLRIIEIAKNQIMIEKLVNDLNTKNKELIVLSGELKSLKAEMETAKKSVDPYLALLDKAEKDYDNNPTQQNYSAYQTAYNQYFAVFSAAKKKIDRYNAKVDEYNQAVDLFNKVVDEYNTAIKNDY